MEKLTHEPCVRRLASSSPKSRSIAENTENAAQSSYHIPKGLHLVPSEELDMRSDNEIDDCILNPEPVPGVKNIWFFWHNGYSQMPSYAKRNVRAWHCRFSRSGWVIRVVDRQPQSSQNIANYFDINDSSFFPEAFAKDKIIGPHRHQHTSDLVRFPILLKYGGVYADVSLLQIGDLDGVWAETVGNVDSPFEILAYNIGSSERRALLNFFMAAMPNNALLLRAHKLLLALWAENGGKRGTDGMHKSLLLKGLPETWSDLSFSFYDKGNIYGPDEVRGFIADYAIQIEAMAMAMSTEDQKDAWNGPEYVARHVYAMEFMVGASMISRCTNWNGYEQFRLLSLPLTAKSHHENHDQKLAREMIESSFQNSFAIKMETGIMARIQGATLASLWKDNEGSDNIPGTYAHWLRHGVLHWVRRGLPERLEFQIIKPVKVGPLLSGE